MSEINCEIVAAVDINPHANLVYKNNFKNTRTIEKTIEVRLLYYFDFLKIQIQIDSIFK